MARPVAKKTSKPSTESQNRSRATWVFGSLLLAFSVWVFVFAPDTLPEYKHRMLGIFLALLSGLFAFFLTGDMGLEIKSLESRFGKVGVKATGGIAVFTLVLWWWSSPLAPIGVEKKLGEIKQDTEKIVALLQEELSIKNTQIGFLQGQIERLQTQEPSPRARELAAQIPADADPYALALKAMAESRFDDARRLLGEAARDKEVELARIYKARGQTETYAGRYADAVGWYRKALALKPDDPYILNETTVALTYAGQYAEAMPLSQRALAIREKVLGPEHPGVATSLNNLAALYYTQGQYAKAEPLYRRALAIGEKVPGPEHPGVAASLNNLAALYYTQGQYAKAEPLYRQALAIGEKVLGPEHPDVATSLNNLAGLYDSQGKYAEAEPLYRRALAIREKALGPAHPAVAQSLNNLAVLYHSQGEYAEAEPLYQRALAIREKVLGPEHPDVATVLENYADLLRKTNRETEAAKMEARATMIRAKHAQENPTK